MSESRLNPYYPGKMAVIRKERSAMTAVQRAMDAAWSSSGEAWRTHRADALIYGLGATVVRDGVAERVDPFDIRRPEVEPVVWFDEFPDPPRRWWEFWR